MKIKTDDEQKLEWELVYDDGADGSRSLYKLIKRGECSQVSKPEKKEESEDVIYDLDLLDSDMSMQTYRLVRKNKCSKKECTTKKTGETNMKEERNTNGKEQQKMEAKKKRENFQKMKTKFRSSKEWKEFRQKMKNKQRLDALTNQPLRSNFSLHHMLLDPSKYRDLSIEDNFLCLNRNSHQFLHFAYSVAKRIGKTRFLNNVYFALDYMLNVNEVDGDKNERSR